MTDKFIQDLSKTEELKRVFGCFIYISGTQDKISIKLIIPVQSVHRLFSDVITTAVVKMNSATQCSLLSPFIHECICDHGILVRLKVIFIYAVFLLVICHFQSSQKVNVVNRAESLKFVIIKTLVFRKQTSK